VTRASSDPGPLHPATCLSLARAGSSGQATSMGLQRRWMWKKHEVRAKAWTATSEDVVPSLEASFTTSLPTVLDFSGENFPSSG
jgi:hypothetical protein